MAYNYKDPTADKAIANIVREEKRRENERKKVKRKSRKEYKGKRIRVC